MSRTLHADPLRSEADVRPGAVALESRGTAFSFAEMDLAVDRACDVLARRGVRRGSRVVIRSGDRVLQAVAVLATLRMGALAVPVGERLPPGGVDELVSRLGGAVRVEPPDTGLPDSVFSGPHAPVVRPPAGVRRRATVLFTSGSTGEPKAIVHRLTSHLESAVAAARHLGLRAGDRWLATLPLNHVGGLAPLFRCLVSGATWVVPGDPPSVDVLRSTRATHVSVVSTQLRRLLDAGTAPPSSLRCVLLGGGPTAPDTVLRAVELGWPVVSSYGTTETASMVTATGPEDPEPLSAGRAVGSAEVRTDGGGQILVRGAGLGEGVLEGGRVRPLAGPDGWYRTGDRGTVDASGRLSVEGRMDRGFVSGGENVQPETIERRIESIPGVRRAVVVPVAHPDYGQRPVAFVDGVTDPDAIVAELRRWLPSYLVPDAVLPMPEDDATGGVKASPARLADLARRLFGGG